MGVAFSLIPNPPNVPLGRDDANLSGSVFLSGADPLSL